MKRVKFDFGLFSFGFAAYSLIELAWRRYTHYTMGLAGGICFLILYHIYKKYPSLSLFKKCLIGSAIITLVEFCFGCLLNLRLHLGIWDYSNMPFNILGQVCPLFSFIWMLLCIPICFISKKLCRLEKRI